jgi:hypothetical protein
MSLRRTDIDWPVLRGAVAAMVGALLAGGAMLAGSHFFLEDMRQAYERDHRQFRQASRRYIALDGEEQQIRSYLPRLESLMERGIVGAEHRLGWMDALRGASARLRLAGLRYDIRPQQSFQPESPLRLGNFRVYASRMDISVGLLHEEDLLRLLHEIDRHALGTFTVDSCVLTRMTESVAADARRPNVSARCEVLWLTLRQASQEAG